MCEAGQAMPLCPEQNACKLNPQGVTFDTDLFCLACKADARYCCYLIKTTQHLLIKTIQRL